MVATPGFATRAELEILFVWLDAYPIVGSSCRSSRWSGIHEDQSFASVRVTPHGPSSWQERVSHWMAGEALVLMLGL